MSAPLRLLFLAESSAASRAVGLIEQQTPVAASLATTGDVLRTALRNERWDGALVIPGGPVPDAEIARIVSETSSPPPLMVVGAKVPEVLRHAGASAVSLGALGALAALLKTVSLGRIPTVQVPPAPRPPSTSAAPPIQTPPARDIRPPAERHETATGPIADAEAVVMDAEPHPVDEPAGMAKRVANELAAGDPIIENVADHLPIGVYRTTPDGRFLYANEALALLLGMEVQQMATLDVRWDLGYPRDAFEAEIRDTGSVHNWTVEWTQPSGRTVRVRENARVVRNARGRVLYYEGTMEAMAEANDTVMETPLQRRLFNAAVTFYDAADVARTTADLHREVVQAVKEAFEADWALLIRPFEGRNRIVAKQGLSDVVATEVETNNIFASTSGPTETALVRSVETAQGLPEPVRMLLAEAGLISYACFPLLHNRHPLGAIVVGYQQAHTYSQDEVQGGEMLAWHFAGHLARRMAEQSLEDSETTLQFVTEHTGHALYRRRHSGEYDYLSPVIETLTGFTPEALIGLGGWDALVTERVVEEGADGLDVPSTHGDHRYRALCRIESRGGETRWIENTASTWCDASGQPIGVVGVLHDVTERKQREDAVADEAQRALARQAALVELATVGVGNEIAALVMQRAVEQACLATGVDEASIWLREDDSIVCRARFPSGGTLPRYRIEAFKTVVQSMAGQRALAISDVRTDERADMLGLAEFASAIGATGILIAPIRKASEMAGGLVLQRRVEDSEEAEPWSDADIAFVAAVADALALTLEQEERSEAKRALEASETRYRTLAELTSDYAFAVQADAEGHGPIAWATDAFERISGYSPEEIGNTRGLAEILHPDSFRSVCRAFAKLAETGMVDFEARIMTRSEDSRWVHHRARMSSDGQGMVYHSGEDVTERKHFEAELVDAREQAEAMGRLKSAFLANMSHEIRTPLTSILGYSDLLLDEIEADQRDFVLRIVKSGIRLLDTLNSVLDLARLEADGVDLNVRPLTVADHVESAIEPFRDEAERKGLGFHIDTDATVQAELDPACLKRIVTNLVGNAVKFTEAGGVAVQVEADATHVHLHVRDTGVGMDDAFLENLFTDFQQESFGHNRSHEGTGLGMSITKRYVDLLGGTIAVDTQKGVGTSFVVSFPLTASPTVHHRQGSASEGYLPEPEPSDLVFPNEPPQVIENEMEVVPMPSATASTLVEGGASLASDTAETASMEKEPPTPSRGNTSGVRFEMGFVSSDTPSAIAAFVSPSSDSLPSSDPPVSHDPSLPTDMFFNRPVSTPDAADVPGEAPTTPTEAAKPPTTPTTEPSMIVRGPASPSPDSFPWPTAPSAPAAAASPVAPPAAHTAPPAPTPAPPAAAPAAPAPSAFPPPSPAPAAYQPPAAPPSPVRQPVAPASPAPQPVAPANSAPAASPVPPVGATASPVTPAAPATPAAAADDKPALLVVEDNDDTRMLLDRILRSSYTVTAVGDARSALIEMNRNQFVGLVLDINLGGKETGADILRIARTLEGYTDVFAIALTAYALPGDRERLLEAGFNEYISKPFTRHSLMEALSLGLAH